MSPKSLQMTSPPPHSTSALYIIFFMLGVGTLFPWNAFITATTYFAARFCGTARSHDYLSFFGVTFNVFEVSALAYCVRYNQVRRSTNVHKRRACYRKKLLIFSASLFYTAFPNPLAV